jgi:hypothetical protein
MLGQFTTSGNAPWQPRSKPTRSSKALSICSATGSDTSRKCANFARSTAATLRVAQDLGVTPAELDTLARRGPHASDELPKLLKSLGIDEATLSRTEPRLQRDMVRVCASCRQKARCDHGLDAGTSAQHYTEYCPNAPAIEELGPKAGCSRHLWLVSNRPKVIEKPRKAAVHANAARCSNGP